MRCGSPIVNGYSFDETKLYDENFNVKFFEGYTKECPIFFRETLQITYFFIPNYQSKKGMKINAIVLINKRLL